ncbi:MAG: hypothetical protein JWO14_2214 [Solirubrobacterales bacterium]|nr:hypothetical protein [Solirubrobacterales bacterium]
MDGKGRDEPGQFRKRRRQLAHDVAAASEAAVLEADPERWAAGLSDELAIEAPAFDLDAAAVEDLGEVEVDCTHMAGISYTLSEMGGPIIRKGSRFRLTVPATDGEFLFALAGPFDAEPWRGEVNVTEIVRIWDWPYEKGASSLKVEINRFKAALQAGGENARRRVDVFNAELAAEALALAETRRTDLLARREFLGDLEIPVVKREDAPGPIEMPPLRRKRTPARAVAKRAAPADPAPLDGSQLDALYEQVLQNIRAMGKGLERAPGSYADAGEEALRDQFLLILNTHFEGNTYAEAFNKSGKTDVLIRVEDKSVFIAECKWWSGPKALDAALAQLYGYATWRDSRLALIFFVKAKDIGAVFDTAAAALEAREEFDEVNRDDEEHELDCRVHWPGDDSRRARLTVQFFHLPPV